MRKDSCGSECAMCEAPPAGAVKSGCKGQETDSQSNSLVPPRRCADASVTLAALHRGPFFRAAPPKCRPLSGTLFFLVIVSLRLFDCGWRSCTGAIGLFSTDSSHCFAWWLGKLRPCKSRFPHT